MSRGTAPSIPRTATFAWSPAHTGNEPRPLLATGTISGALDASFSNEAQLEVWDPFANIDRPDTLTLRAATKTSARFNRLAWAYVHEPDRPKGVIAAGFESGELSLYDVDRLFSQPHGDDSIIYKHTQHSGPVRGLDFNRLQPNLLASGATNGEIYIWDLTNPQKPYSPGSRSRNLDDVTSLAWNPNVAHVLATSSSSGCTVVWDLKGKREVVALNHAQANVNAMQGGAPAWMAGGLTSARRGGVSAVCWHPENPTKLVTAYDDDLNPIILLWDLRNAMAPERIFSGHEKGILGLNWCRDDANLLLSSSKDCRTLCWNASTGEVIGELPASSNWAFQTEWCPRNPGMVATASFDGSIHIDTLQATLPPNGPLPSQPSGAEIFEGGNLNAQQRPIVSLKQTPRWLQRPVSASFGFGGKLVTCRSRISPAASGAVIAHQTATTVRQIVTDSAFVERAVRLENAVESGSLATLCETRVADSAAASTDTTNWHLLRALFRADSRDELVTLLGFSKDVVKERVEEAVRALKPALSLSPDRRILDRSTNSTSLQAQRRPSAVSDSGSIAREPLVTFADTTARQDALSGSSEGEGAAAGADAEATPSETSITATSDATKFIGTEGGATESDVTEPSLFSDDAVHQMTHTHQAAADFYSSIRSGRPAALPEHVVGAERAGSSVAATIGSRPSSVASEKLSTKQVTFRIYPQDESEADRLLTRALVLGDFESAVSLCLSSERFADAILLAVRGGSDLLTRTQKAYFERRTSALPYLRLFQSIVTDDLDDIVQNADLAEWQEIFVVLCTFAKSDDFAKLAEQLGHRLEFQAGVVRSSEPNTALEMQLRKDAVLCYLAAGRLEKIVTIWSQEMHDQEQVLAAEGSAVSLADAHDLALQSFIEKVTVFRSAVRYVDVDLAKRTRVTDTRESDARTYGLATLYDHYREYAELLAGQGMTDLAVGYIAMTPGDYLGPKANVDVLTRLVGPTSSADKMPAKVNTGPTNQYPLVSRQPQYAYNITPQAPTIYDPYAKQMSPYAANAAPSGLGGPSFQTPANYGYPALQATQTLSNGAYDAQILAPSQPTSFLPLPPPPLGTSPVPLQAAFGQAAQPGPPPLRVQKDGAWNDAPSIAPKRGGSAAGNRPHALVSPFPNQPTMQSFTTGASHAPPQQAQQHGPVLFAGPPPPPSRGLTRTPVGTVPYVPTPPPPTNRAHLQTPPPVSPSHHMPGQHSGSSIISPTQQAAVNPPPSAQFASHQAIPSFSSPNSTANEPQVTVASVPTGPYDPSPGTMNIPAPPHLVSQGPSGRTSHQQHQFAPPPSLLRQPMAPARILTPGRPEPPKSKYPPGDRTHLNASSRPIFDTLLPKIQRLRTVVPLHQKKLVDDTERRLNILFDALNCETLSTPVVTQLREIVEAIEARDPQTALRLHLELLTSGGAKSDDISSWMSGLKVVAQRAQEL